MSASSRPLSFGVECVQQTHVTQTAAEVNKCVQAANRHNPSLGVNREGENYSGGHYRHQGKLLLTAIRGCPAIEAVSLLAVNRLYKH